MRYFKILAMLLFLGEAIHLRAEVVFEKDILPVFEAKCLDCHSPQKGSPKAGLRLDTAEGILAGSKKNKVVVPGDPANSLLLKLVSLPHDDLDIMPPEGKAEPLTGAEVLALRKWIEEGAKFGEWTERKADETSADDPKEVVVSVVTPKSDGKMAWDRPSPVVPDKTVKGAAKQIDQLVDAGLTANKVLPNPVSDDATFIRRVYLDAVGRIPSFEETSAFLESDSPNKRAEVIDQILDTEGYVSRQYNYWAEVLRVQSKMRQVSGENYQKWIKQAIRDEKPYNQFVSELITAEGHIYENGASGYYLRDNGMPLDNMANTVQIFLGTSLACAQCHNHPFDKWTQQEFYKMAAFTYGVQTVRPGGKEEREKYKELAGLEIDNRVKQAMKNMVRQTRYGYVSDEPRKTLKLPDDYKYDDAQPKDRVSPDTIFGDFQPGTDADHPRLAYAEWMTSPSNPRFTVVIANRLWKQAMGIGVIEPHDDMKDNTVAYNPELMAYLVELMKSLKYNQKDFLRVIYNTQTYQRESVARDATSDEPFYFQGPLLRRMSAEQIWDSVLSLIVPDLDKRTAPAKEGYGRSLEDIERIREMSPQELLEAAEAFVYRKERKGSGDRDSMEMQESMSPEVGEDGMSKKSKFPEKVSAPGESQFVLTSGESKFDSRSDRREAKLMKEEAREQTYPRGFVRASELQQPAPAGHFLEEFGQSDREVIEGSHTAATVTQILNLMNGPAYAELAKSRSVLSQTLRATSQTPSDLAEALFLSIYSEYPSDEELSIATEALARDPKMGLQDLTWALLNTQRFMFIR